MPKRACLKPKAFSVLLDITHGTICLNSVLLQEEEKSGEKRERYFFLPKLPSEERVLLQFHIQAFSSAHQCLLRSTEAALTVTLFYPILALSDRVTVRLQALAGLLWLRGAVLQ